MYSSGPLSIYAPRLQMQDNLKMSTRRQTSCIPFLPKHFTKTSTKFHFHIYIYFCHLCPHYLLKLHPCPFIVSHLFLQQFSYCHTIHCQLLTQTNFTTEPATIRNIFLTLSHYEHSQVLSVNLSNTGWNDKIVVLKKTTRQLYFKTFIEKNQFR